MRPAAGRVRVDKVSPLPEGGGAVLALVLAGVLWAPAASADASWLGAHGRLFPSVRLEVYGGPRAVGAGVVQPDHPEARSGVSAEASWSLANRVLELRGARTWQLTQTRFATPSVLLGFAGYVVPEGGFDLGVGPHLGATLNLGGDTFNVDLGLQTGIEVFVRAPGARLPQRALLVFNLHVGDFTVALMARSGVDLRPGHQLVVQADLALGLGWLGLDRAVRRARL